jgi:hypothetical protein
MTGRPADAGAPQAPSALLQPPGGLPPAAEWRPASCSHLEACLLQLSGGLPPAATWRPASCSRVEQGHTCESSATMRALEALNDWFPDVSATPARPQCRTSVLRGTKVARVGSQFSMKPGAEV